MFESLVNGLLAKFLAPYIEGLSSDDLTIRAGTFELRKVRLKESVSAELGVDILEVADSVLERITVRLPLLALLSGKISIEVSGLSITARTRTSANTKTDDELLLELRDSRRKRICTRSDQLRELRVHQQLVEEAKKAGQDVENKAGFAAKLVRQLVNNVTVDISDVGAWLQDPVSQSEFGAQLERAYFASPQGDTSINSFPAPEVLCKELGIEGLTVFGGHVSSPVATATAFPLLRPLSLHLGVLHDPIRGELRLSFDVQHAGDGDSAGILVSQGQLRALALTGISLHRESARLQALLRPAGTEELVDIGSAEAVDAMGAEFIGLLRRAQHEGLNELLVQPPLERPEKWRLQVLWDIVPEELLARWFLVVDDQVRAAIAEQRRTESLQWRKQLMHRLCCNPKVNADSEQVMALSVLREQGETLEELDPPQKMVLNVNVSSCCIELGEPNGSTKDCILRVLLHELWLNADCVSKTDHRGVPSAEWGLRATYRGVEGYHKGYPLMTLTKSHKPKAVGSSESTAAFKLDMRNELERHRNICRARLSTLPLQIEVTDTFVPSLESFFLGALPHECFGGSGKNPEEACKGEMNMGRSCSLTSYASVQVQNVLGAILPSSGEETSLSEYFDQGEAWLRSEAGKRALDNAAQRIPDAIELDVHLSGPKVSFVISKHGRISVEFGKLEAKTPHASTMDDTQLSVMLYDMALSVQNRGAPECQAIEPFQVNVDFAMTPSLVNLHANIGRLHIEVTPEAVGLLAAAPDALASSFMPLAPESSALDFETPDEAHQHPLGHTPRQTPRQPQLHRDVSAKRAMVKKHARRYLQVLHEHTKSDVKAQQSIEVHVELAPSMLVMRDTFSPICRVDLSARSLRATVSPDGLVNVPIEAEDGGLSQAIRLSADMFNVRVGRFEPLLEPLEVAVKFSMEDDDTKEVSISCRHEFLLNVSPTSLQLLSWYVPFLMSMMEPAFAASQTCVSRARMINLTADTVELTVNSTGDMTKEEPTIEPIGPTGSTWVSLDPLVLPTRAERLHLGKEVAVDLNRVNSQMLRTPSEPMVQVRRPHVGNAFVLVSSQHLVFNDTTLCLRFRYAQEGKDPVPIPRRFCAVSAFYLGAGCAETDGMVETSTAGSLQGPLLRGKSATMQKDGILQPGEFASVPSCHGVGGGDATLGWDAHWQVQTLQGDVWGAPKKVSGGSSSRRLTEKASVVAGVLTAQFQKAPKDEPSPTSPTHSDRRHAEALACGDMHFLADYHHTVSAPPARVPTLSVRLLPAMRLVSGLPVPIEVQYRLTSEEESAARQATVPRLGCCQVFDIAVPGGLAVRVRFESHEWSAWSNVTIEPEHKDTADEMVELKVGGSQLASAGLLVSVRDLNEIVIHSPSWIIDRTGSRCTFMHGGALHGAHPLPQVTTDLGERVTFANHHLDGYSVAVAQASASDEFPSTGVKAKSKVSSEFSLPNGGAQWRMVEFPDGRKFALRKVVLPFAETQGCKVACFELVPRLVLKNTSPVPVSVQLGADEVTLSKADSEGDTICHLGKLGHMRFRPVGAQAWSERVPTEESVAGSAAFVMGEEVWTTEFRSDVGVLCVIFRQGSDYRVVNYLKRPVVLKLRGVEEIKLEGMKDEPVERPVGWLDPFGKDLNREMQIGLSGVMAKRVAVDPCVAKKQQLGAKAAVKSRPNGSFTEIAIADLNDLDQQDSGHSTHLSVLFPRIGISLMGERAAAGRSSELLYLEIDVLHFLMWKRVSEQTTMIDLSLDNIQLDCQEERIAEKKAVVLANYGLSSGEGTKSCLRLLAQRSRVTSPTDCSFDLISLDLDKLELGITDKVINSVLHFIEDATPKQEFDAGSTIEANTNSALGMLRRSDVSLLEGDWEPPPPQPALQVSKLHLSALQVKIFCSLRLGALGFLPRWFTVLLSTVMMSNKLELTGSRIRTSEKKMAKVRGAPPDFFAHIASELLGDLLMSVGSLLGNSSILNLPAAPLKLGGYAGSHAANMLGDVSGKAADLLSRMAFDKDFSEQQRKSRQEKHIHSATEGIMEAVNDLGDAVGGMFDIVRKPMEGAREHGVAGFVQGVGLGVASSVAKPIVAVSNAVTDIGVGVAASAHGATTTERKKVSRRRPPRMLFGPLGAICEYSYLEAAAARAIQDARAAHKLGPLEFVDAIVPLARLQTKAHSAEEHAPHFSFAAPPGDNVDEVGATSEQQPVLNSILLLAFTPQQALLLDVPIAQLCMPDSADKRLLERLSPITVEPQAFAAFGGAWPMQAGLTQSTRNLIVNSGADRLLVPMPWQFGEQLLDELMKALSNALPGMQGDWLHDLRDSVAKARAEALAGEGHQDTIQTCEVWEVERTPMSTGGSSHWHTPFLPTLDKEHRYRWMHRRMRVRHQLLDPDADWVNAAEPPIVMLPMWQAITDWEVVRCEDADADGWQYALNWGCSHWHGKPRPMFDQVRRRKWTRGYRLDTSGVDTIEQQENSGREIGLELEDQELMRRGIRCCRGGKCGCSVM